MVRGRVRVSVDTAGVAEPARAHLPIGRGGPRRAEAVGGGCGRGGRRLWPRRAEAGGGGPRREAALRLLCSSGAGGGVIAGGGGRLDLDSA